LHEAACHGKPFGESVILLFQIKHISVWQYSYLENGYEHNLSLYRQKAKQRIME
jgi:hypothetical protein